MYGKYRVTAYDENGDEIGVHVYDGTPDEVTSEMVAYLLGHGIVAKRFYLDIVTYESASIR